MKAFGRQVIVEIGQPGQEGRRFDGLRIHGRVEKSRGGEPNTANVEIINTTRGTVSLAQESGAMIRVLAGYDVARLIFEGDINRGGAIVEMNGADRTLRIEAQDGGRALRETHIEESFSGGVTPEQVINGIREGAGLAAIDTSLPEQSGSLSWPRGLTIAGMMDKALDQVTEQMAAEWSIQDGALQVIPRGGYTEEESVLVSATNGNLIGSPKPGDDGLEVTALLDGRIKPGRRIKLESRDFKGVYGVNELTHIFDSGWDNTFYTVATCRET